MDTYNKSHIKLGALTVNHKKLDTKLMKLSDCLYLNNTFSAHSPNCKSTICPILSLILLV